MMKCLKDKLKAKSGASLAATLLLFLVCAVIGSAVLTAASATSGRMAERRESDKAYYSVTSAAKLFADEISSYTVVVEETATITETDTGDEEKSKSFKFDSISIKTVDESKAIGESGYEVIPSNTASVTSEKGFTLADDNNQSLLEDIVLTMLAVPKAYELENSGEGAFSDEVKLELWKDTYKSGAIYGTYPASGTKDFTITPQGKDDMIVYGRVSGTQSGEVEAIFSNKELPSAGSDIPEDAYYVTVTCTPHISASISVVSENTTINGDGNSEKKSEETKEIKINYTTILKEVR